MAKKQNAQPASVVSISGVERVAKPLAEELGLEWVEAVCQKESRGKCLCIYLDKADGLTLDDCERYHKRVQPLLEDIDYDFLEVSSPGIDRPVKTQRDFEKNEGGLVEVKLYAPAEGGKLHRGYLRAMDGESVTIALEEGREITFARAGVAIVKPVIELADEDE